MEPDALYEMFVRVWREFYEDLAGREVVENLRPDQSRDNMKRRRRLVGVENQ